MTKLIALIDADGILFSAALAGETTCDGEQMEMRPIGETVKDCLKRIDEVMEAVGADDAYLCLSDRRNFRYDIDPTYKGNRKKSARPIQLDRLREALSEETPHKVWLIKGLEADDVCGIASGTFQRAGKNCVIVSPDKDMLTIPGKLVTPRQGKYPKAVTISAEQADIAHVKQTLTGDQTDGYKGCPGWGERRAGMLIDSAKLNGWTLAELWQAVIAAFVAKGLTEEDCLAQARLSRILRVEDWDAQKKEPILFTFPAPGGLALAA